MVCVLHIIHKVNMTSFLIILKETVRGGASFTRQHLPESFKWSRARFFVGCLKCLLKGNADRAKQYCQAHTFAKCLNQQQDKVSNTLVFY